MIQKKIYVFTIWLGRQGLQFIETFKQADETRCNTVEGLFNILNNE